DRQVRRQRLEATDLHQLDLRFPGPIAEGVDDLADEGDLPGQIDVVRSTGNAGFDHRPPVKRVGAHEVEHDAGARSHRGQGIRLVDVGDDGLGCADAFLLEDSAELCDVAGRRRPGSAGLRGALGKVGSDAASRDPGGPEDDDIEVSVGHLKDHTSRGLDASADGPATAKACLSPRRSEYGWGRLRLASEIWSRARRERPRPRTPGRCGSPWVLCSWPGPASVPSRSFCRTRPSSTTARSGPISRLPARPRWSASLVLAGFPRGRARWRRWAGPW